MKKYKWIVILLNLILLLGYFGYSMAQKEKLLREGELVLLELAPVDPRSLMQGDYMALRYRIATDQREKEIISKRGYCVVRIDSNGIATRVRFQEATSPRHEGEFLINYTSPNQWTVNIGAESYFFQEGDAKKYEVAKYGGVRIDQLGNSLLVGLYDENKKWIK
jgi:uncharacterized membrane-anchored protein